MLIMILVIYDNDDTVDEGDDDDNVDNVDDDNEHFILVD